MDIIKDLATQPPEVNKPFYTIFENRDGTKVYYKTDYMQYLKLVSYYGNVTGSYSYTCINADKVV